MAKLVTIRDNCLMASIVSRILTSRCASNARHQRMDTTLRSVHNNNQLSANKRPTHLWPQTERRYLSVTSRQTLDTRRQDMDGQQSAESSDQRLSSPAIDISDNCVKRLKKVLDKPEDMLRVEVYSGGCSGLQYRFDVTNQTTDEDMIFEKSGVKVVVDKESMQYLNGSIVDYNEELIKSSFRVIDNPQSQQGCSCGASFALKLDNGFTFKK